MDELYMAAAALGGGLNCQALVGLIITQQVD